MADMQVIVRRQTEGTVPGSPAWSGIMPGPVGDVSPGRRHDAADQTSAGRHLALTVSDPE